MDRLCNVAIRPQGMPRGVTARLYELANSGQDAISSQIARTVLSRKDAVVGIFTGAADTTHLPNGENDGPIGSVVLARALELLNYDVTIFTEIESLTATKGLADLLDIRSPIIELSKNPGAQHQSLSKSLDIAIAIEKPGVNVKGIMHSCTGHGYRENALEADLHGLFNSMNKSGKITIGIGDGGNEIGFGNIRKSAQDIVPFGRSCQCGCGGGIIAMTEATFLYPVGVSNWGAYALSAALAIATKNPLLAHRPEMERSMLALAVEFDCRDGVLGKAQFSVDGISGESSAAVVHLLGEIVETTLASVERDF
jgi:hypothetical protein